MKTIEQVLADARGELPVLRKHGQAAIADALERLCDEFAEAAEPFTKWMSETEAVLASPHAAPWFRQRFRAWEQQGLARWSPRKKAERQYLSVMVPRRMRGDEVRDEARRAARGGEAA
jgi:hypothetical protein